MAEPVRAALGDEWSDVDLGVTAELLSRGFGIALPASRRASMEDGLRRAMTVLRIADPSALRAEAERSPEAREAIVRELTIGETYFLRESGHFDFLRQRVLPLWAREAQPLRCWSAGCSTGEEPYSLAIVVRESGWRHSASILGTDLVPSRLAAARRGRYGRWAFRGVAPEMIERYFEHAGRAFVLDPAVRAAVDFRVLDLVRDDYATVGARDIDVVFCRNVLIYFDAETVRRVAERLLASLSRRGWLFLSASDPMLSDVVPCRAVPTGAGLAYRRLDATELEGVDEGETAGHAAPAALMDLQPSPPPAARPARKPAPARAPAARPAPAAPPPPVSPRAAAEQAYAAGDYERAAELARAGIDGGADDEDAWLLLVRALGNRGAIAEARSACDSAVDRHPLSGRLASLHATLLLQAGRVAAAIVAARRSLYLDRRSPLAHFVLGDALARGGERVEAARAFANASELLATRPDDELVGDADGTPAGRLRGMAEFRVRELERAAGGVS